MMPCSVTADLRRYEAEQDEAYLDAKEHQRHLDNAEDWLRRNPAVLVERMTPDEIQDALVAIAALLFPCIHGEDEGARCREVLGRYLAREAAQEAARLGREGG